MVEIKNLSLDYGEVHILDDISLSISEGECVLFTGKSGSGERVIIVMGAVCANKSTVSGTLTKYISYIA